jgi:transketolase C-terminal domain/subunit
MEVLRFNDTLENEGIHADFVNVAAIHPLSDPVVYRTHCAL